MLDIGICGTDKEICSFEYGTPPAGDDYLVIGHESVAEIVEGGEAETDAAIAEHEAWKAAGRPGGTIPHEVAMTELLGGQ